ncbi:hypothetical protein CEUSTIGMA_g13288.t1 [Chlamydomonas eustigma]|uniref:Uncharacterized protein n=1 Tax=Chlamydomonas eustigma TaxID=1157962 RepID=A0A250XSG8_9CHLO|nr:hypothetical protein CEUSTIGMA_g13288.t1 [Chlamydomonas eustigma]|eukprot:GAX85872.1 hypothetical protein CEUSTIGMA_g13288.t1 [Chlamydomonas eustigma]
MKQAKGRRRLGEKAEGAGAVVETKFSEEREGEVLAADKGEGKEGGGGEAKKVPDLRLETTVEEVCDIFVIFGVQEELPTFIDDHSVHKFVSEFLENLLRTNQPLIDDELIDAVTRFVSGEGFQPVGRSGKVATIKSNSQKRSRSVADEAGPSGLRSCPHHANNYNNQAKKPRGPPEDCPLYGKEGRLS